MPTVTAQDPTFNAGRRSVISFVGSIARTDTSAKTLFTLPAGAIPTNILIAATAPSNAGTTATISVGISGGGATDISGAAIDVKTAGTGGGSQKPSASASTKFGVPLAADTIVTGIYAETGAASSSGGPWVVLVEALVV